MRKSIDAALLLLASTIAIELNRRLLAAGFDVWLSLLVSVAVSVGLYKVLEYGLLEFPVRYQSLRQLIKPESRMEGNWISRPINIRERPYSYITIDYNPYSKEYIYSGLTCQLDGTIGGSWKSTSVKIKLEYDRLWYIYAARMHDEKAESTEGYGVVNFEKDGSGKYTRATGFFGDVGSIVAKSSFFMNRLEEADLERYIGKKSIQTHEDLAVLIRAYHHTMKDQGADIRENGAG